MIDLQLVGYTADLKHLVFDLRSGTGEGRYRLLVDPDLFATLDTLRDARREAELPVGDPEEYDWSDEDEWEEEDEWEDESEEVEDAADDGEWEDEDVDEDVAESEDESDVWDDGDWDEDDDEDELASEDGLIDTSSGTEPALGDWLDEELDAEWNLERAEHTDDAVDDEPRVWINGGWEDDEELDEEAEEAPDLVHVVGTADTAPNPADEIRARAARPGLDARAEGPALSPLEIQTLLRQGRSVRSVAKAAGTTVEWVEKWLGPIEAERDQVVAAARRLRLERARLGKSREAMGAAVTRNLKEKGLGPSDVSWEAARHKDGRWRVSARYVHRKKTTTASWLFDPVQGTLEASNDAGSQLGFTRRKQRA